MREGNDILTEMPQSKEQQLQEMQRQLALRLEQKRHTLTQWAERVVQQTQYADLSQRNVKNAPVSDIRIEDITCLFRIDELVFSEKTGCCEQLTTILNALHKCGASCFFMLRHENGVTALYLGAVNRYADNRNYISVLSNVLKGGIEETLDGTKITEIQKSDIADILENCLDDGASRTCVTAVSCVAAVEKSEQMVNGIESILESATDSAFTILVIADAVDQAQVDSIRRGYESIGTQLSASETISYSEQESKTITDGISTSTTVSESLSRSISQTKSHTDQSGWNRSVSDQKDKVAGVAAGVAAVAVAAAGHLASPIMAASFASQVMGGGTKSDAESGGTSDTEGISNSSSEQNQKGFQKGDNHSETAGTSSTTQYSVKNRHISNLLKRLDQYLEWIEQRENYGMYNSCTYIISSDAVTNRIIASQYQALMQGEDEFVQPMTINEWTDANALQIRKYLMRMEHPHIDCGKEIGDFTPAMLSSSREISRQMAMPRKSVIGLSVMEYADFSRGVVSSASSAQDRSPRLNIGKIVHHGKIDMRQTVQLDLQSMAAHTFIAGTNGSGKSNTVFNILEEMHRHKIPFMVIEPAKGEYKNVFGRDSDVSIYGTNDRKTPLLHINPFYFNDDMDLSEHIDRLLSVFNSSWPMYSAMPQILKESIEGAYAHCGWNIRTRRFCGKRLGTDKPVFPTVHDVLNEFHNVMESTKFSGEVKGNYEGALSTRLESLCNGVFRDLFSGDNLSDEELFNSNVIVDLSSIGSAETKSMIMGILVIRLQEFRLQAGSLNHPLRHVTVLEEAHHLLRKTSSAQSDEGSNLMGKSVEMLTAAIAEMRSAGEGFIIVDQSPGLLDEAVLRNTNTKIIMRLPEGRDRDIVGKTMGLDDDQAFELSRLKTGVGAVYQQNWLGAVLCQINKAEHEEEMYRCTVDILRSEKNKGRLTEMLYESMYGSDAAFDIDDIINVPLAGRTKYELLLQIRRGKPSYELISRIITELYPLAMEKPAGTSDEKMRVWYELTVEENELQQALSENAAHWVVYINVKEMAKTDEAWKKFELYRPECVRMGNTDAVMSARGVAFSVICPLRGRMSAATVSEKQSCCDILERSDTEVDWKLAGLLRNNIEKGTIRDSSELEPYAPLVWIYMGGGDTWDALYDKLNREEYSEWDTGARQQLKNSVVCEKDTESSLLSLFLQNKGKDPAVKRFFNGWYNKFTFTKNAE